MPEAIQDPINAFPEHIQELICHYCEAKGYPTEYFIQGVIAAVSTALGRAVTLNTGNYTTIASVWCIILGKKGITKSEPLVDAFQPISDYQFAINDKYAKDCSDLEDYKELHPKERTKDVSPPSRVILSDATPEKLILMLAANPKGCGIVYDEISGFVKSLTGIIPVLMSKCF